MCRCAAARLAGVSGGAPLSPACRLSYRRNRGCKHCSALSANPPIKQSLPGRFSEIISIKSEAEIGKIGQILISAAADRRQLSYFHCGDSILSWVLILMKYFNYPPCSADSRSMPSFVMDCGAVLQQQPLLARADWTRTAANKELSVMLAADMT